MPKVRILYPTGLQGTKYGEAEAGEIVSMPDEEAQAFIQAGHVELEKAPTQRAKKETA